MKLLISNSILIILENRKEHFSFLNHLIKKLYNKLYKDQDFFYKENFLWHFYCYSGERGRRTIAIFNYN